MDNKERGIFLNDWSDFISMISSFEGLYSFTSKDFYSEISTYPNEEYWREKKTIVAVALQNKYKGVEVLLASYVYEDYNGYAFVLFRQNGKLYEVNGSHCSCYELEGQWEPEEASVTELRNRVLNGYLGEEGNFKEPLLKILDQLESEKAQDN